MGDVDQVAEYLSSLPKLDVAYISVPTRPPAEEYAEPPSDEFINAAFQVFSKRLPGTQVALLTGYEGSDFFAGNNIQDEILSILAVHPMREDAMLDVLKRSGRTIDTIDELVQAGRVSKVSFMGRMFYILPPRLERR
ncbi:hypothetical protein [Thermoplasma sp.]|uniref:hypothetical protein n=1 Tax=Thermoplasma sp. TaxID=1973142 RepID=UPI0025DEEAE9|nr:hypothetical protein [Thermoplasma sp.]